MLSYFFSIIILMMMKLMKMPIFTLVERKILSYIQNRKGPKKVSMIGILQPIADGMKLILKNYIFPKKNKYLFFLFSPLALFLMMLMSWKFLVLFKKKIFSMEFSFLLIFGFFSLKMFFLMTSSWGSNSKYSLLGCLRGCMQVISYEICFFTMIFFPCSETLSYNFISFFKKSSFLWTMNLLFMMVMWVMLMIIETNRAPFDFAEGESELVSGFNTEYSSFSFALLFLSEYGKIILMSFLSVVLFFLWTNSHILLGVLMIFFFIVFRGAFPRFRMDLLSSLCWIMMLPTLLLLFFMLFIF